MLPHPPSSFHQVSPFPPVTFPCQIEYSMGLISARMQMQYLIPCEYSEIICEKASLILGNEGTKGEAEGANGGSSTLRA